MKTCQVHPLSITIGAIAAALLLFACSSGSGSGSAPSPGPYQAPAASSLVSFYSDTPINGPAGNVFDLGAVSTQTVITDFHWESSSVGRLLVNGVTVFGWGFGGSRDNGQYAYATPERFSLTHGIVIPAGASIAVETGSNSSSTASWISLAGYNP